MMDCAGARSSLHPYLDAELPPGEVLALEAHLLDCPSCRREHDSLRLVVDTVRGARPLYDIPPSLEHQAQLLVSKRVPGGMRVLAAAAAALVCIAAVLIAVSWNKFGAASRFSRVAADSHLRYAQGLLPLDVESQDPEVVNRWFARRVDFELKLPNHPANEHEEKPYRLAGARLMHFRDHEAAFVVYEMAGRPISLLIASAADVRPAGGQAVRSGNLAFRFADHKGLRTITWTDRGLTYAQVSDLNAGGAESCVICHGSAAERRNFENLH